MITIRNDNSRTSKSNYDNAQNRSQSNLQCLALAVELRDEFGVIRKRFERAFEWHQAGVSNLQLAQDIGDLIKTGSVHYHNLTGKFVAKKSQHGIQKWWNQTKYWFHQI